MRRLLIALAGIAIAATLAACGSSSSTGASAPAPLREALSYFPTGTPFVATVDTAARRNVAHQFEAGNASAAVENETFFALLARIGINWNRDVKPLLGNPAALGVAASQLSGGTPPLLAAWPTKSRTALTHLMADLHGVTTTGTHDGATLYSDGKIALAVSGATLLVSQSADNLTAALDRHQANTGFTGAEYAADTSGLPSGVVSYVGDLTSALGTTKAAKARRVPWVAAMRSYGITMNSTSSNVSLHFRIDTGGRSLTDADLPIASGAAAPTLAVGGAPIALGLRDPAQIWSFFLAAQRATDPAAAARLTHQEQVAQTRTGVDLNTFFSSLTGDLDIVSNTKMTIGRIEGTPSAAADWEKLVSDPGDGSKSTSLGQGLYRIVERDGTTMIAGAVGDALLLGKSTPAAILKFAHTAATASHGTGSAAFQLSMSDLMQLAVAREQRKGTTSLSGGDLALVSSLFGDLTGSVQATPQALTGSATLPIHLPTGG